MSDSIEMYREKLGPLSRHRLGLFDGVFNEVVRGIRRHEAFEKRAF